MKIAMKNGSFLAVPAPQLKGQDASKQMHEASPVAIAYPHVIDFRLEIDLTHVGLRTLYNAEYDTKLCDLKRQRKFQNYHSHSNTLK